MRDVITLDPDMQQLAADWPLALKLDLPDAAEVVVAGSYEGKAMQLLLDLYPGVMVYGFDPQEWASEAAFTRLTGRHPRETWALGRYGLGVSYGAFPMSEWHTDAASFIEMGRAPREGGVGQLQEFGAVMTSLQIERLDLLVLNMEGYEYELVPHLLGTGWATMIKRLAIQWHLHALRPADSRREMDLQIDRLVGSGFNLTLDDRPTWTLMERPQ